MCASQSARALSCPFNLGSATTVFRSCVGPRSRAHHSACNVRIHHTTIEMAAAKPAAQTALDALTKEGAFNRKESGYRNQVEPGGRFPPEAGRYHLYISYACPWAARCLATLYLKGLEDVIGLSVVHPVWARRAEASLCRTRGDNVNDRHCGWQFRKPTDPPVSNPAGYGSFPCDGCIEDTVGGHRFLRDLYEAQADTGGRFTVPVLFDKKERVIVNNESSEILRIFNSQFNHLARNQTLDLYPSHLRPAIDEINDWVYHGINNGVYKCGFARAQAPYEAAFAELFSCLDRCEKILSERRFIAGDQFTEADIRLFVTLVRFDEVYVVYFKTNRRSIREYPNLFNYVKEIYQMPEVKRSVNMQHIKFHYFASHPELNAYAVVPVGPGIDYDEPHDRARKFPPN